MNLNDNIDKCMKNALLTNKLFKMFRILLNEYNIRYFIEFADSGCYEKILVDFVNVNPELKRFVFMSNSETIQNDLTEYVILNYGLDEYTKYNLIKVANEVGFKVELLSSNKLKLTLYTKK